ncbi:MAG: glycosyltransferase family 4 protein [Actinomycetota bacterium]|nr:glycosyltransferase family 4 protein [Actinomycetota bacterium]
MRILSVNHTSRQSGAELSLLGSLAALPATVETSLVCPEGPLAEAARTIGIPVAPIREIEGSLRLHPWHTPRAVTAMAGASRIVRRRARSLAADLIHANSTRAALVATLAARAGGPPVVVSVHDCLPAGPAAELTRRVINAGAAMVLANSRYTAKTLRPTHNGPPIRIVYPPVELERFDPEKVDRAQARARLGVEGSAAVLGVVAQLTPWKDQDTALRTLARVRRARPDAILFLVGEAKFVSKASRYDNEAYVRSLHRRVAELGLGDAVEFLGHREDVPEVLRAFDLLLVPSWEEPFGMSMIEAMAMGTPVLATEVGGPSEVIEDGRNGCLLPPRRPEIWAQAAESVLGQPDLRMRLGREGRRTAGRFSLDRHVDALVASYREVLEQATDSPARPQVHVA